MDASKPFPNGENDAVRGIDFIGITCVFCCHDGKGNVLLHKRSEHCRDEQGKWEFGAGSHEFGATAEETVKREVLEEYGAQAKSMRLIDVKDVLRHLDDGTQTHWLMLLYVVELDPSEAKNNEPYKMDEIGWFTFDSLPSPLHSQMLYQVEAVQKSGMLAIAKKHGVGLNKANG